MQGMVCLDGHRLDIERAELRDAGGALVAMRPQSMAVLVALARHAGRMVGKDELMRTVWPDLVVTDDSLVQCVKEIRRALGDDDHQLIRTEPKRGYRLVACEGTGTPHSVTFEQQIRFATTCDGVRIAWASSGKGLPIVRSAHWMTHLDWDWKSEVFGPRIRALSERFRFVRYDGRGCGLSDRDTLPGTLDEQVSDLEAVVDAADLSQFALLGASGGAAIAIRYAARHPGRVRCLLLLGAFARGALARGVAPETVAAMSRLIEDHWGQDNPAFRQMITNLMWPGATAAQMESFNQLQRVACTPASAAVLQRRIAQFDAGADLAAVRCPTLVMNSPRDSRVPFEEGRRIAAAIPGARLEPIDSPNHTPLAHEPAYQQVLHWIEEFVQGAERLPGAGHAPALVALRPASATGRP